MPIPSIQFEQQHEKLTKMNWVIGVSVGVVLGIIIVVIIIVIAIRCRRKKHDIEYRDLSFEDGKIKSSRSVPNLTLQCAKTLSSLLRSSSTGHSPPCPTAASSTEFPQPDVFKTLKQSESSDSESSVSAPDQYSPFQRSFRIGKFPSLEFSTKRMKDALTVVVLSLCNIPDNVRSAADNSDGGFFMKVYLLPDETCQQTKVYKPTGALNQECNECLQFKSSPENTGLLLSAYFIDQRRVRVSLGHTTISMASVDEEERIYRTKLEELSQALHSNIGELELTLTFFPDKSRLKVDIQSCKDLTLVDVRPTSVLLLRVQLLHGRKLSKEKEMKVARLERNPRINEGCAFSLTTKRADISHLALLLTEVMSESEEPGGTSERCIGRVDIGPYLYARGEGLLHWQSILNKPKTPVFMSHSLEAPLFE